MMYAKFKDGSITPAANHITVGESVIFNPTDAQYREAGYLPVRFTNYPAQEDGYTFSSSYVVEGGEIVQKWTKEPYTPEPDPMERMQTQLDENTLAIAELMYGGDAL